MNFQVWIEVFTNYSSLKYSEFILAFQLQFGTYEAESEHFSMRKRKTPFQRVVFQISRPFIFWLSCCRSISEASIYGNVKQFHGSQSRAFSREHSTQPLPRRQGSDRNKLHGARSLFKFLLLKI